MNIHKMTRMLSPVATMIVALSMASSVHAQIVPDGPDCVRFGRVRGAHLRSEAVSSGVMHRMRSDFDFHFSDQLSFSQLRVRANSPIPEHTPTPIRRNDVKRILFASAIALLAGVSTVVAIVPDNPDYPGLMRDIVMLEEENLRPLLAKAEASEAAFLRENDCAALGALGALENQLEVRAIDNPNTEWCFRTSPQFAASLSTAALTIRISIRPVSIIPISSNPRRRL